jgi:hypothetical protein
MSGPRVTLTGLKVRIVITGYGDFVLVRERLRQFGAQKECRHE